MISSHNIPKHHIAKGTQAAQRGGYKMILQLLEKVERKSRHT